MSLESDRELFFRYVNKTDTCWHWLRVLRNGYGGIKLPGAVREQNAHRVCWHLEGRRKLDVAERLINACGTKGCVNPDHQQVVPRGANQKQPRATQPG